MLNTIHYTFLAALCTICIGLVWFGAGAIGAHIAAEALRSCPEALVECD